MKYRRLLGIAFLAYWLKENNVERRDF